MSAQRHVMVGVDGSDVATDALKFAASEAKLRDCALIVVHVSKAAMATTAERRAEIQQFDAVVRDETVETIHTSAPGVKHLFVEAGGNPGHQLRERSADAELLVVGTHKMGRLRGFVIGSVSQYVAAHAICPVAAVSGEPVGAGPIVLAASASDGGLTALRFACDEARRRDRAVEAVRVATVEGWPAPAYGYPLNIAALEDDAQAQLEKVLKVAHAEFPDVEVRGKLQHGDPFDVLSQASATASLVIAGSRRSETSVLPHLGPVAAWLLHQAQAPLVIVPYLTVATATEKAQRPAVATTS